MELLSMSQVEPTPGTHDRKAGKPLLYSTSPAILPGTAHIIKWPTELLRECFELAIDGAVPLTPHSITYYSDEDANIALQQQAYTLARSISSTCKRFRAAMVPILYSQVYIIPPLRYIPQPRDHYVPMQFVRTMNETPAIRAHVKSLGITTKSFFRIKPLSDIEGFGFARLSKVSLTVMDNWSTQEWEACCTNLRNLPVLSELHVDLRNLKEYKDNFRPFYRILGQLPRLSILTLEGVGTDRSRHEALKWGSDATEYEFEEERTLFQVCRSQRYPKSLLIHISARKRLRILYPAPPVEL
jgi:hypothetical protein